MGCLGQFFYRFYMLPGTCLFPPCSWASTWWRRPWQTSSWRIRGLHASAPSLLVWGWEEWQVGHTAVLLGPRLTMPVCVWSMQGTKCSILTYLVKIHTQYIPNLPPKTYLLHTFGLQKYIPFYRQNTSVNLSLHSQMNTRQWRKTEWQSRLDWVRGSNFWGGKVWCFSIPRHSEQVCLFK